MTPRWTTKEAKDLNNRIVDVSFSDQIQHLLKFFNRVGYNAGPLGWNYDIYNENNVTIVYGDRVPDSIKYNCSREIVAKVSDVAKNLSWSNDDKLKAVKLMKEFTDSIHAGIHDPTPINNFTQFKKQLVEQKDMWPEKSFVEIGKILNSAITKNGKEPVNTGLGKNRNEMNKLGTYDFSSCKTPAEELGLILGRIYRIEKNRSLENVKKIDSGFER